MYRYFEFWVYSGFSYVYWVFFLPLLTKMVANVFLFIHLVNSCCCCVFSCLYMNLGIDENGISNTCYPLLKIITKWCGAEKSQKKPCVIWMTSCTAQDSWLYWSWTGGQTLCWRIVNFTQSKWSVEPVSYLGRTVWTNKIRNKNMFRNHWPAKTKV